MAYIRYSGELHFIIFSVHLLGSSVFIFCAVLFVVNNTTSLYILDFVLYLIKMNMRRNYMNKIYPFNNTKLLFSYFKRNYLVYTHIILYAIKFTTDSINPASWLLTSLATNEEVGLRFPALPRGFSLVVNYSTACTNRMSCVFRCLYPFSSLCCLRRRFLISTDHKSEKALQLCLWSKETFQKIDIAISSIKGS